MKRSYSYSMNWMGPISSTWFTDRGLKPFNKYVRDHWSMGRIDVRGGNLDCFGAEIAVPMIRDDSWRSLQEFLETYKTKDLKTFEEIVGDYQKAGNPDIIFWEEPK